MPDGINPNYNYGEDIVIGGYDSTIEDASTVEWVDQTLEEAERGGFLDGLGEEIVTYSYSTPTELNEVFSRAREQSDDTTGEGGESRTPLTREEIREKIFAKLRRPDGAPFAAGYTSGPAARKEMYAGEDTGAGWRSTNNPTSDVITTQYDDRASLGDRATGTDAQGRIVDAQGVPVADATWGWVIDAETRSLLLFDPNAAAVISSDGTERWKRPNERAIDLLSAGFKIRATHHTTPVAGMPVVGAGILKTAGGFVTEITDESGHYRPEAPQQYAALQALMNQGYSLEQAKVTLSGRSMGPRPTDKADWLDEARDDNPDFPVGDVNLRPEQFMQTEGDEYQIRSKIALNEEIKARGQTPPTTEGWGRATDDDDDDDLSDDDDDGLPPGKKRIEDPSRPGYWIIVDDIPDTTTIDAGYSTMIPKPPIEDGGDGYTTMIPKSPIEDGGDGYTTMLPRDTPVDPYEEFREQARSYLASAGRSAFAEWFRTLDGEQQSQLLADPQIASAWREESKPPVPKWQPAEGDFASAATQNAAVIDALPDRGSAPFVVAAFSLLVGAGHDDRHAAFVRDAADNFRGQVAVRKAGLGRGAGSLTFTGVPPAKQGVVRSAVQRFSRKEVVFQR